MLQCKGFCYCRGVPQSKAELIALSLLSFLSPFGLRSVRRRSASHARSSTTVRSTSCEVIYFVDERFSRAHYSLSGWQQESSIFGSYSWEQPMLKPLMPGLFLWEELWCKRHQNLITFVGSARTEMFPDGGCRRKHFTPNVSPHPKLPTRPIPTAAACGPFVEDQSGHKHAHFSWPKINSQKSVATKRFIGFLCGLRQVVNGCFSKMAPWRAKSVCVSTLYLFMTRK